METVIIVPIHAANTLGDTDLEIGWDVIESERVFIVREKCVVC